MHKLFALALNANYLKSLKIISTTVRFTDLFILFYMSGDLTRMVIITLLGVRRNLLKGAHENMLKAQLSWGPGHALEKFCKITIKYKQF